MKTKDLLLLASGLALGYLIFKKDLFKKKSVVETATALPEGELLPTGGERKTKEDICEAKWTEFSSTARFASEKDMAEQKAKFMNSCLLG